VPRQTELEPFEQDEEVLLELLPLLLAAVLIEVGELASCFWRIDIE
jgi:hypothetical protein